jgi:cystathionine beta-lyase/cystathionine gamma-synthase
VRARYAGWLRELEQLRGRRLGAFALARERDRLAELVRTQASTIGGLVTASDWQSPSFGHSLRPQAGRHEGRIVAHRSDYKRDRHHDAAELEAAWLREYVDDRSGVRVHLTASGMAAFTTIVSFLTLERRLDGPVLVGRSTYHESRELLLRALGPRAVLVDELDTRGIVRALERRPAALFLDSLCNAPGLAVPDLTAILAQVRGETVAVVDNTCLATSCRPLASAAETVIVYESALKLAQFGLDRANAGVIAARGRDVERLDGYREHLGTNIPDVAVHAIPPPSRALLDRRLARAERNAANLAERLGAHHPGRGSLVELRARTGAIPRALAEARRRGVQLVAGTSFGFDCTRIYETAPGEGAFLRLAAGTEDRLRLERLGDALAAALSPFDKRRSLTRVSVGNGRRERG